MRFGLIGTSLTWFKQSLRTSLVAALVFMSMVLPASAQIGDNPPATVFFFQLTLDGNPPITVTTFELGEDPLLGPRLTVRAGPTLSPVGLGALQMGQLFEVAVLQIFDQTLTHLASYRLSTVRVRALRDSGDATGVTYEVVLFGKTVTVIFP